MKTTFVARAPGKLFLLGEYAVLDGATAVVTAVDRHIEVRLRCRSSRHTRISAPGHCEPLELPAERTNGAPAELRFALAAIEASARRLQLEHAGFDIAIKSELEAGSGSGQKLGLGGSAAVTAAIVAAVYAAAGRDVALWRDDIFATAFGAHRAAQRGVGSGADVAAAVYGGVLAFEPKPESLPQLVPLQFPDSTQLLVAWSGRAAATGPLVGRYLALGNGDHDHRRGFVRASRASVGDFVDALQTGWLSLRSVDENGAALERLSRAGCLGLLTQELARLILLARAAGAGAKLSGAGGGDCTIALTGDADVAERVRTAWRAASFTALGLRPETHGVSVAQA